VTVTNNTANLHLGVGLANQLAGTATTVVSLNLTQLSNVQTAAIPTSAISQFANANLGVNIDFAQGSIYFDAVAIADLAQQAVSIAGTAATVAATTISVSITPLTSSANMDMFAIAVFAGGQPIVNFNGEITISLPYGVNEPAVWYIGQDGEAVSIDIISQQDGYVTFTVTHTGTFAISNLAPHQVPLLRLVIGQHLHLYRGVPVLNDVAPFMADNRTMVPLRLIAEALGASVYWDAANRSVDISLGTESLTLTIDSPLPDDMGTPVIVSNRTFVPARYVSEMLGATVRWDIGNSAVYVYHN